MPNRDQFTHWRDSRAHMYIKKSLKKHNILWTPSAFVIKKSNKARYTFPKACVCYARVVILTGWKEVAASWPVGSACPAATPAGRAELPFWFILSDWRRLLWWESGPSPRIFKKLKSDFRNFRSFWKHFSHDWYNITSWSQFEGFNKNLKGLPNTYTNFQKPYHEWSSHPLVQLSTAPVAFSNHRLHFTTTVSFSNNLLHLVTIPGE